MPASQTTSVGLTVLGDDLHEHEAKPKMALVGSPLEVEIVSRKGEEGAVDEAVPVDQEQPRLSAAATEGSAAAASTRTIVLPEWPPPSLFADHARGAPRRHARQGHGAINREGGQILAVDQVEARGDTTLREITVECTSTEHRGHVISTVQAVRGAKVVEVTDRTFEVHRRGKIHTGLNCR